MQKKAKKSKPLYKKGAVVYIVNRFGQVTNCEIQSICDTPYGIIYSVKGIEYPWTFAVTEDCVFISEEDAWAKHDEQLVKQKEEYAAQINSVDDLVLFLINHMPTEFGSDTAALKVAKEKALEFNVKQAS